MAIQLAAAIEYNYARDLSILLYLQAPYLVPLRGRVLMSFYKTVSSREP
jgi:hypothetical protein